MMDLESSAGGLAEVMDKEKATSKRPNPPSIGDRSIDHGENDLLGGEVDQMLAAKMVIVNDVGASFECFVVSAE
jgi:hypothetical protein